MADEGDADFGAAQFVKVIRLHTEAVDDLQAESRNFQELMYQVSFVQMVGMQHRTGEVHVDLALVLPQWCHIIRHPEGFRKRIDGSAHQARYVLPFTRVGDEEGSEKPQPRVNGLNMEIVIAGLPEDGAGKLLEIGRHEVPFDHGAGIEIGWFGGGVVVMDVAI